MSTREEIGEYLGGECAGCGAKERLEVDHIDPADRRDIVSMLAKDLVENKAEFDACQLLCKMCHTRKSAVDRKNGRFSSTLARKYGSKFTDMERRAEINAAIRPYVKAFFAPNPPAWTR